MEDVPGNDGDVHQASSSYNSVGSSSLYGGNEVRMFHCHDMPLKVRDLSPKLTFLTCYKIEADQRWFPFGDSDVKA